MTNYAKALLAVIGATVGTAHAVQIAHGWSHVDWTTVGTFWSAAVAVFAYPNTPTPPKPSSPPTP